MTSTTLKCSLSKTRAIDSNDLQYEISTYFLEDCLDAVIRHACWWDNAAHASKATPCLSKKANVVIAVVLMQALAILQCSTVYLLLGSLLVSWLDQQSSILPALFLIPCVIGDRVSS